jgi:hypothetical protein
MSTPRPLTKRLTVAARRTTLPALRRVRPDRYSDAAPYRVLAVPTASITHLQRRWRGSLHLPWLEGGAPGRAALRRRWHAGAVLDGDWDQAVTRLDEYHLTRVLQARFGDGADWEDIPYIRRAMGKVRTGEPAWGGRCTSEDDVRARCRYLDDLHRQLVTGGYRPADASRSDPVAFTHFLVNIGRDGTIIRNNDGKHRIILSRIIGLPSLQARVLIRHRAWQEVRDAVRRGDAEARHRHAGHPDLRDLT